MKKKIKKIIPEKIGPKTLVFADPIFRQRIYVLLNQDEKGYQRFLNRVKAKDVGDKEFEVHRFKGFTTHIDSSDGTRDYVIYMKEFQWAILHQGTLIHEIVHVVVRIFQSNNIPFNPDTQEFIAHAVGRIYEMISHRIMEK